jgi:hypothetical protein
MNGHDLKNPAFWRRPESSQNNQLLDGGFRQHDEFILASSIFLILR